MHLWQDGLMALLAAIGLSSILWAAAGWLFSGRPTPRRGGTLALVPGRGDGEHLEEQVRYLMTLGREEGCFDAILLTDCGLTEEGRRAAELLARDSRMVIFFCGREALPGLLEERYPSPDP